MNQRLELIQALRAVAALAVLFGHLAQMDHRFASGELFALAGMRAFAGVDLFFVISGFIMVYVTRSLDQPGIKKTSQFLFARATRIYPPYWLFLSLSILGFLALPGMANRSLGDLNLIQDFMLWPTHSAPALAVGWTLIHEMYFYIAFTGFLLVSKRFLPALLAVWLGFIIIGHLMVGFNPSPLLRLVTHPLTAEFIAGAILGLLAIRFQFRWIIPVTLLALAWYIVGLFIVPFDPLDPVLSFWQRVLLVGVPAILLVYAVVGWEQKNTYRPHPYTIRLGDWSYSLYLGHLLVLVPVYAIGSQILPDWGGMDNLVMALIAFAGSILLASLAYHLFEKPTLFAARQIGDILFGTRDK